MEPGTLVLSDAICNLVCGIRADASLFVCSQKQLSKEWTVIRRDEKGAPEAMRASRRAATDYLALVGRESLLANDRPLKSAGPPHLQRVLAT